MPGGKTFSDERSKEPECLSGRKRARVMLLNTSFCSAMKELDALQQIWEITRDWEENWNQWKTGRFLNLQTEAMETMAHGLFRRLTRLAKEFKVCGERREGGIR